MMKWTTADMPDQSGRVALITGANSGLGYETALALAQKNAHVIMTGRSEQKLNAARDQLLAAVPGANVSAMLLDLASQASVRAFADAFLASHDRLDLLINNAGVMAPPRQITDDGFEMQMGTNHFGHFTLTGLLLELLLKTPASRVVSVSSVAHRMTGGIDFDDLTREKKYVRYFVYSESKLANLLFAFELDRRLRAAGAQTISVGAHPGYSHTNLQSTSAASVGGGLESLFYRIQENMFMQPAHMGALPQLYAATVPDVQGGDFYGPHGFMHTRGYPAKETPSAAARDEAAAARLWEASEALTGVKYGLSAPQMAGA